MISSDDASTCVAARGFVLGWVLDEATSVGTERKLSVSTDRNASEWKHLYKCPKGAICSGGARVEILILEPGFTRSTDRTLDVFPCKDNPDALENSTCKEIGCVVSSVCVGGQSTGRFGESVCRKGNTGPYCAACDKGYVLQGSECIVCKQISAGEAATPLIMLMLISAALLLVSFATYRKLKKNNVKSVTLVDDSMKRFIVEKFKIVMGFVQVVSGLIEESGLQYPPFFTRFIAALSIFGFDVFNFLSIGCVLPMDFFDELLATCLSPLVLALGVGVWILFRRMQEPKQAFTSIYLVVLFCMYPGVTRKVRRFAVVQRVDGSYTDLVLHVCLLRRSSILSSASAF